jgi:hypothetical protein
MNGTGMLQSANVSIADRYDDVDRAQQESMAALMVSVPAGRLVDMLAQRGDPARYTWSAANRLDCYAGALETVDILVASWSLDRPVGLSDVRNWIDALRVAFDRPGSVAVSGDTNAEGD